MKEGIRTRNPIRSSYMGGGNKGVDKGGQRRDGKAQTMDEALTGQRVARRGFNPGGTAPPTICLKSSLGG